MELALLILVVIVVALVIIVWRSQLSLQAVTGEVNRLLGDLNQSQLEIVTVRAKLAERNARLGEIQLERNSAQEELAEARGAGEAVRRELAATKAELAERNARLIEVGLERDGVRVELAEVLSDRQEIATKLAAVEADQKARSEELAKAQEQIETQFKGVASDVVSISKEQLLKQATEQFQNQRELSANDLDNRQQAIEALIQPVKDNLAKFEIQVNEMERNREGAYERLATKLESLGKATSGLSDVLKSPQLRGKWGEQKLHNILELSGMSNHIDFYEQEAIATNEGKKKPDAVVKIPDGANVVIDAKFPFDSYRAACEADDDHRRAKLNSHAEALLGHAKALAVREYSEAVDGSLDFVVMFVPTEPILDSAMSVNPDLWEQSWQKHRVLIATPGLLLALLRTVALSWRQHDVQINAQKIADAAKELYSRLRIYIDHVNNLGVNLDKAVNAYNASIGSLQSRLLPQARRFEELGASEGTSRIIEVASIEKVSRRLRTK